MKRWGMGPTGGLMQTLLDNLEVGGKIRENLAFAFVYNIAAIPLAALGVLTPVIAGAAMALSSVSVVTNALVLRRLGRATRRV